MQNAGPMYVANGDVYGNTENSCFRRNTCTSNLDAMSTLETKGTNL